MDEILITRVKNGWLLRPKPEDSHLIYPEWKTVQVASTLDELVGIVLRWGESTVPKDSPEVGRA